MKPSCPNCGRTDFSSLEVALALQLRAELNPSRIICPNCRQTLRVTDNSRIAGCVLALISMLAAIFLAHSLLRLEKWQSFSAALVALGLYSFALWPRIIKFEPWAPFNSNLPGKLFARISKYLWLPLLLLAVVAMLAVRFKWWM